MWSPKMMTSCSCAQEAAAAWRPIRRVGLIPRHAISRKRQSVAWLGLIFGDQIPNLREGLPLEVAMKHFRSEPTLLIFAAERYVYGGLHDPRGYQRSGQRFRQVARQGHARAGGHHQPWPRKRRIERSAMRRFPYLLTFAFAGAHGGRRCPDHPLAVRRRGRDSPGGQTADGAGQPTLLDRHNRGKPILLARS